MVGAMYNGNAFMGKVIRYHMVEKTAHCRLVWHTHRTRLQLDKGNHVETRLIPSISWMPGGKLPGGTWSDKTSRKSLRHSWAETMPMTVATIMVHIT
jgi:hypothetical protein